MTVANETARSGPYLTNGLVRTFPYGYPILDPREIVVYERRGAVKTIFAKGTYEVSGVGNNVGGTVTLPVAPAAGAQVYVDRDMFFTQQTDLVNQGPYYAEVVEDDFDRGVMRDQQLLMMLRDLEGFDGPEIIQGPPGPAGDTPEFRMSGRTLQFRYVGESNAAWRNLVTINDGAPGAPGQPGQPGQDAVLPVVDNYFAFSRTGTLPASGSASYAAAASLGSIAVPTAHRLLADAPHRCYFAGGSAGQIEQVVVEMRVGMSAGSSGTTTELGRFFSDVANDGGIGTFTPSVQLPFNIPAGAILLVRLDGASLSTTTSATLALRELTNG